MHLTRFYQMPLHLQNNPLRMTVVYTTSFSWFSYSSLFHSSHNSPPDPYSHTYRTLTSQISWITTIFLHLFYLPIRPGSPSSYKRNTVKSSHLTSNPALLPSSCGTLGSWLSLWPGFLLWLSSQNFPPERLSPLSLSRIGRRRQRRIRSLLLTAVLWTRNVFRRAVGVSEAKRSHEGGDGTQAMGRLSWMLGRVCAGLTQSCSHSLRGWQAGGQGVPKRRN